MPVQTSKNQPIALQSHKTMPIDHNSLTHIPVYDGRFDGVGFKRYIFENAMQEKMRHLMHNLDDSSCACITLFCERILNLPDIAFYAYYIKVINSMALFTPHETNAAKHFLQLLPHITKRYTLPQEYAPLMNVFYYHHGLLLLPSAVHAYIRNYDMLDIGAYIGDSTLILTEYQPRHIYAFDISQKNITKYIQTMHNNAIDPATYTIDCLALRNSSQSYTITDTGSLSTSLYHTGTMPITAMRLDDYIQNTSIIPRFIKVDIEGDEWQFLNGAEQTLQQYRPILSIAVYHCPKHFFEMKIRLAKLLPNYSFIQRKLDDTQLIHDITLIAYPNECMQ